MNFRVGACALLVCLAGCSAEAPDAQMGRDVGKGPLQRHGQKLPSVQLDRSSMQSIASAPDRGELLEYKNKGVATKQEGAYTWYPVAISEAHALKAVVTGEMTIPSPDGSQVKLKYERHEEQADGNWTWIGRVVGGDQKQEAILTFGEKAVYGSIPQRSGAPLSLQTRAGALYAVQTDLSKVKNPNTAATDMMVPPAMALRAGLMASKAQVSQSAVSAKASGAASTVDVAIGYTQGFATAQGSDSAAVTRLTFLIAVGNQSFENSLITGALRLVSAVKVNYTDTTTNQAALEELTGVRNEAAIAVPASLAPIRTAREQFGADLVVLVRKFQTPENDGCGIAWLNGAGQVAINPATDDDFGFAVVSDGNDRGTDGNSYFCAEETLVHELSHLMGSAHDRDNSKSTTGALLYGRYPYSFGMKTAASAGNFYTIMAYGENNQNFYRTFSNPLVLKCGPAGNLSCGVANNTDNARSLNQTIPVVATFRARVVPFQGVYSDFDGDGRSDMVWRNSADGRNQIWLAGNSASLRAATVVPAQSWQVVGIGDFNGDGPSDLLWRDNATGRNSIWLSGNSATGQVATTVPLNWKVVGLGDFNGDGRSDILWRDSTSGRNSTWLSGNSATLQATATVSPQSWKVAGVGDFNGDGRSDILWRDTATGRNTAWLSGNSATPLVVTTIALQSWKVAGVGDFNGDGRSDILWRNSSDGRNQIWLAGNSATLRTVASLASTTWKAAQVADFNGDGKADILWRNNSTGANSIWLSADSSTTQSVSTVAAQAWIVVPASGS
ncbi:MAG: FG-GAP-like repeat-containing protein [Pseudoxanthomonas sp.]